MVYRLQVDYSQPLRTVIKLSVNENAQGFTTRGFPNNRRDVATVDVEVISLGPLISTVEAHFRLMDQRRRPGNLRELLALAREPNAPRGLIFGLGSWKRDPHFPYVQYPFVEISARARALGLCGGPFLYGLSCQFAIVLSEAS